MATWLGYFERVIDAIDNPLEKKAIDGFDKRVAVFFGLLGGKWNKNRTKKKGEKKVEKEGKRDKKGRKKKEND